MTDTEREAVKKAYALAHQVASVKTGFPVWCERMLPDDLALFAGEEEAILPNDAFDRLAQIHGALVANTTTQNWPTYGEEVYEAETDRYLGVRCRLTDTAHNYAAKYMPDATSPNCKPHS